MYHLQFGVWFWHWLVEMSLFAEFRVLLSWLCLAELVFPAGLLAAVGHAGAVLDCWCSGVLCPYELQSAGPRFVCSPLSPWD